MLARYHVWPFGTRPPDLGKEPSILEVVLNDRVVIGFLRVGVVTIVGYVVVSVPALILDRRWMKGLGTAGVSFDDARRADRSMEELQQELRETQRELEDQVTRTDLAEQLLWELQSDVPTGDNPPEGGEQHGEDRG